MKAQNTINLGQISGEMKTWNTFILGSKELYIWNNYEHRYGLYYFSSETLFHLAYLYIM